MINMRVLAVMPAYNEEETIAAVIKEVQNFVDEVVVVDDGSSDQTVELAQREAVVVLGHPLNRGQGAALQTGNQYALAQGVDIVVHFDTDGQHEASDIPRLVEPIILGQADIVLGSRFLGTHNIPTWRRKIVLKGGIIFNWLVAGIKLTDAHNGLRALNREALRKIKITQDRMAHATEIPQEIRRHKLRWLEVPVNIKYTEASKSRPHAQKTLSGALRIVSDLFKGVLTK